MDTSMASVACNPPTVPNTLSCVFNTGQLNEAQAKKQAMKQRSRRNLADRFAVVTKIGLAMRDVAASVRYDGSPVLKLRGCFMAGLATHESAEPDTLVVRSDFEERALLLEDAPETYYVTEYYRKYPLVLVRLSRIDDDALRDLLAVSWRHTLAKTGKRSSSLRSRVGFGVERRKPPGAR